MVAFGTIGVGIVCGFTGRISKGIRSLERAIADYDLRSGIRGDDLLLYRADERGIEDAMDMRANSGCRLMSD